MQCTIEVATGGTLMNKPDDEAHDVIEEMAVNTF